MEALGASTMSATVSLTPKAATLPSSSAVFRRKIGASLPPYGGRGTLLSISGQQLAKSVKNSPRNLKSVIVRSATEEDGSATVVAAPDDVPIEKRYAAYPSVLDINQIRDILPHRFPFLLVDRVIEYKAGETAVGIKNVTINDNFFPGHFPERPIMPGVLMVEAMAQVGGLIMLQPDVGGSKDTFFFAGVDKVRFRKPVIAGDTLVMRMTLTKLQKRFGIAKMEGKAYVGGEVVCEGEFMMAVGSSD
uniref:3-hydroxyacyl-[acyl-carrier-protein] dehydratase n=1 Tax=Araucaria cunninghamii TaxID=56994 RepID=A0A0D6QWD4_ARACU